MMETDCLWYYEFFNRSMLSVANVDQVGPWFQAGADRFGSRVAHHLLFHQPAAEVVNADRSMSGTGMVINVQQTS